MSQDKANSRSNYSTNDLDTAVHIVVTKGVPISVVASEMGIPRRTLCKYTKIFKETGESASHIVGSGRKPLLPKKCEADIVPWVIAMQKVLFLSSSIVFIVIYIYII